MAGVAGRFATSAFLNYMKYGRGSRPLKRTGSGIVRRTKRKYAVRQPMKKKKRKITRSTTKFRKATKARKKASPYVKRHYDDYGKNVRSSANYVGFQTHGSHGRLYDIIAEAITKAMLARIKVYPRCYDEELFNLNPGFDRLRLTFKRVSVPQGANEEVGNPDIVISSGTTFLSLSSAVKAQIQAYADFPVFGDFAAYLESAYFYRNNDSGVPRIEMKDIGDSLIEVIVNQTITLRNITPNANGDMFTDLSNVEPIHGKKYVFYDQKPHVIDSISEKHTTEAEAIQRINAHGVTSTDIVGMDEDSPFAHPPVSRQLFSNCSKDAYVSLKAGQHKVEKTTWSTKCKLRDLIEKIYYNSFDKGKFGGYVLFGFERQIRGLSSDPDKKIHLAFDRAVHMAAHCQFVKQKTLLKHYENTYIST